MRLWHLLFVIMMVALMLAISRDEVGRVALVVFITGLIEMVLGVAAIMVLFRTVAAIGSARTAFAYLEAIAATAAVVFIASTIMSTLLFVGVDILHMVVK